MSFEERSTAVVRRFAEIGLAALLSGCASVDLDGVQEAHARCEPPDEQSLAATARMLPGRICSACHQPAAQAARFVFTAAGTIYARPDAACNEEGLVDVTVELLDAQNELVLSLTTNRAGNFFTAEPLGESPLRVRLRKDGRVQEMVAPLSSGACALCHFPGGVAPGRIYLDGLAP
jgi:hypothetical protein